MRKRFRMPRNATEGVAMMDQIQAALLESGVMSRDGEYDRSRQTPITNELLWKRAQIVYCMVYDPDDPSPAIWGQTWTVPDVDWFEYEDRVAAREAK